MRLPFLTTACLLWTMACPGFAAEDTVLKRLSVLIEQTQYAEAWQQAQALQARYEGNPYFDFLFGLAALETGHTDYALFALQRVVSTTPSAARPRLELARTYLQLNNQEAALLEFRRVLGMNPPEPVRQHVQTYISKLEQQDQQASKMVLGGLISFLAGYDSNANSGADDPNINLPIFGNITLDDGSVRQNSPFFETQGQFGLSYPVTNQHAWFANTRVARKHYYTASDFDTNETELKLGTSWVNGSQNYQLSARQQWIDLNGQSYSRSTIAEVGINHQLDHAQILGMSASVEKFDHQQQDLQDMQSLRLESLYQFKTGTATGHQLDAFIAHEKPETLAGKHFNRNMKGVGYSVNHAWNTQQSSSIGLSLQQRKHQAADPTYGQHREDTRLSLQARHYIQLGKTTSAVATAGYIQNDSNLDLYTTEKSYIKFGINYQF